MKRVILTGWMLMGFTVHAQLASTNYWLATETVGQWTNETNWSLGSVPTTNDTAVLTNIAAGPYTVEVDGTDCLAGRLVCGGSVFTNLVTITVRTNLFISYYQGALNKEDYCLNMRGWTTLDIVDGATLDLSTKLIASGNTNQILIAAGGTLLNGSKVSGKSAGGTTQILASGSIKGNNALMMGYGSVLDGATVETRGATFSDASTIQNNTHITFVMGSYLVLSGGSTLNFEEGCITNNRASNDGTQIGAGASGNKASTFNIWNGRWYLANPLNVGVRPNGYLNVLGEDAVLSTVTNVFVGSTVTGSMGWMKGYYGYITVSNGLFNVSNPNHTARLSLGNIQAGFFEAAGGTSFVDNVQISCPPTNGWGRLTVDGGYFTAGTSLVATNGTNSMIRFTSGTLAVSGANILNDSVFSVGDGASSAELLFLAGGTNLFTDGIAVSNGARVAVSGAADMTGSIEFTAGGGFLTELGKGAAGALRVHGALTLDSGFGAASAIRTDGVPLKEEAVILTADSITGETTFPIITIDNQRFQMKLDRAQLKLEPLSAGTSVTLQ